MASWEEKFHSAVEIIRTLPKEGKVSPTNSMKLKFYSYFKQATEGPCDLPKPGFWEIINRAKWDSWNKLGQMSKEEAMRCYVEEFVKILQEHSLDDLDDISVLNEYVDLMEPYIEYAPKEVKELYKQRQGKNNNNIDIKEIYENHLAGSGKPIKIEFPKSPAVNGHISNCNNDNDSDSDEFSDTLERVDEGEEVPTSGVVNVRGGGEPRNTKGSTPAAGNSGSSREPQTSHSHRESDLPVSFPQDQYRSGGGGGGGGRKRDDSASEEEPGLATAVIRLQHVLEQVVERLDSLETLLSEQRNRNRSWFPSTPRVAVILLLAWPLVLQWVVFLMRRHRRLQHR